MNQGIRNTSVIEIFPKLFGQPLVIGERLGAEIGGRSHSFSVRRARSQARRSHLPEAATLTALEAMHWPGKVVSMENLSHSKQDDRAIRELYPTLTEPELKEAEANLRRYLQIALQFQQESDSADGKFDTASSLSTMKERSNVDLKS